MVPNPQKWSRSRRTVDLKLDRIGPFSTRRNLAGDGIESQEVTRTVVAAIIHQVPGSREVNPVVMSMSEFSRKVLQGDRFVSRIVNEAKIFLKGGSDDLGKLAADRPDQGAPG